MTSVRVSVLSDLPLTVIASEAKTSQRLPVERLPLIADPSRTQDSLREAISAAVSDGG